MLLGKEGLRSVGAVRKGRGGREGGGEEKYMSDYFLRPTCLVANRQLCELTGIVLFTFQLMTQWSGEDIKEL